MASVTGLSKYIRFQLSQLCVQNKHHDFEHISRNIARLRICENILPATGPVSAGGDQGRDFETYRSYLSSTPLAGSTFLGLGQGKKIVFACSIQKNIYQKVKDDLQTICGGHEKIDAVYYFCEADVPVGKRHELQDFAKNQCQVRLEIFDGQAISEQLATNDLFWIATEYLSVSADMFPRIEPSSNLYQGYKKKWLIGAGVPQNYADFYQIKYALRCATFNKNHRPDVMPWIKKMEIFLSCHSGSDLRRRAIYEIAVASLRGIDNLTSQKERVIEYFSKIDSFREMSDLEDASCLLTYCTVAYRSNHFEINEDLLASWMTSLINRIEALLKSATEAQSRAYLCMIRGYIAANARNVGLVKKFDWKDVFKWWNRTIKEATKSILFPLERFSDILTILTKVVGDERQFIKLCNDLDELIVKRSGGYVAAEKCRDRAVSCYESGEYILAIRHLHKSKIHWFSAETIRGSIISMLVISECYEQLNLLYAAKYYAAAAIYLIHVNYNDAEKDLLARAFFRLADCFYRAGEWLEFIQIMHFSLLAHINFDDSPLALEKHEELRNFFIHACIMRIVVARFSPDMARVIEEKIAAWPIDKELRDGLDGLVKEQESCWQQSSLDEIWEEAQEGLSGRPFCDLGVIRQIGWRALGIEWLVEFKNEYSISVIVEEFVSVLQIIMADLAVYDLCLLPTRVKVICELSSGGEFQIEEIPDNSMACWRVLLPYTYLSNRSGNEENNIFSFASAILYVCSVLSEKDFSKKLREATKEGLLEKTFFARSYSECYSEIIRQSDFDITLRSSFQPLNSKREFHLKEHKALSWVDNPGPGYTRKLAEKYLKNRYERSIKSIRLTLPKLLTSMEFRDKIQKLKEEGYLDWQVLMLIMNLSLNYRVREIGGVGLSMEEQMRISRQIMYQEESEESIEIPLEVFSDEAINLQKSMLAPAASKIWGLSIKQKTPDLNAIKKYLDVRYNNSIDDVDHVDYFKSV